MCRYIHKMSINLGELGVNLAELSPATRRRYLMRSTVPATFVEDPFHDPEAPQQIAVPITAAPLLGAMATGVVFGQQREMPSIPPPEVPAGQIATIYMPTGRPSNLPPIAQAPPPPPPLHRPYRPMVAPVLPPMLPALPAATGLATSVQGGLLFALPPGTSRPVVSRPGPDFPTERPPEIPDELTERVRRMYLERTPSPDDGAGPSS
jgi:hypothetical protein